MKNPSARQLASTSPCQRTSRPEDADARNGQSAPRLLRTHHGQAYHTATCSLTADSASPQSFADKRSCGFRRPAVLHKNDAIHSNAATTSASRSDSGAMSSLHNEAAIPRPIASTHSLELGIGYSRAPAQSLISMPTIRPLLLTPASRTRERAAREACPRADRPASRRCRAASGPLAARNRADGTPIAHSRR